MRIFLLPIGKQRYTCYFESEPDAVSSPPAAPGPPAGRWRRWTGKLVDGYRRLEKKRPLAERLCARLRKLDGIEVVYPESLSEAEAREHFFDFLKRQAQKQRSWKRWDTVMACLGAPLFFLPGPNVWFYYPAVRALGHHYAESGCKKFLSPRKKTRPTPQLHWTPSAELAEVKRMFDAHGRRLDKSRLAQIGQALGLAALRSLYEKKMT